MPNLDGLQSTRLIRQMGYSAPIVALTAFADESNVKQCLDSGMDMFLSKPIRRRALKQVLQKFATIPEEGEISPTTTDSSSKSKSHGPNHSDDPTVVICRADTMVSESDKGIATATEKEIEWGIYKGKMFSNAQQCCLDIYY